MKRCLILGAGISGLSAAWFAREKFPKIELTLVEKTNAVGGWMQTKQNGPFQFELGPRTFQRSRCKELLALIQKIGLSEKILNSEPGKRYLLDRGKLVPLSHFWKAMLGVAVRDLFARKGSGQDESIYSFALRRFGKRGAEQFLDPMALGIFAGDIRKLSVQSCFPFLLEWEQRFGSVILGALRAEKSQEKGLFTLSGGMGQIGQEIVNRVPMDLYLNAPVEELRANGAVVQGKLIEADCMISALPAAEISRLTGVPMPVRMETLDVVNAGYIAAPLPKRGYGYLVPTKEREPLLGMIWDTELFPVQNQTKVTAMVRGSNPVSIALDALKRHLGIDTRPEEICHTPAEIPQYELGHKERISAFEAAVKERFPRLILLGNYLRGASVNACVKQAQSLAIFK